MRLNWRIDYLASLILRDKHPRYAEHGMYITPTRAGVTYRLEIGTPRLIAPSDPSAEHLEVFVPRNMYRRARRDTAWFAYHLLGSTFSDTTDTAAGGRE